MIRAWKRLKLIGQGSEENLKSGIELPVSEKSIALQRDDLPTSDMLLRIIETIYPKLLLIRSES